MLSIAEWCRKDYEGKKAATTRSLDLEREATASAVFTTGRSEHIVERLKAKRFIQIFNYLDQVLPYTPALLILRFPQQG